MERGDVRRNVVVSVRRNVVVSVPASGPGAGQRDAWQSDVNLTLERDRVRIELPAGASGRVGYVSLEHAIAAVEALRQ